MDSQMQSHIFSLPLETRQSIYAALMPESIHVFLREGKVAISTCTAPNTARYLDGFERRKPGKREEEAIWARRLRSSWGPHWQCEEVAQRMAPGHSDRAEYDSGGHDTVVAMLWVCKRM